MERCPYCFKPLPESGVCDCRYEESKNARIEEALHPGAIVGACYQIGAVLGKGGFGITYKAFDLNMQKIVAIKEFYPDGMVTRGKLYGNITGAKISKSEVLTMSERSGETYRKSLDLFYREAVALGKLDKLPNVVHAYHIFRENGTAYIVMEYVNGQSLKSMVAERGKIPERELLGLLDPVLTALGKVHEENILHRDIAPDNIMIENGNPVLLDFGAARVEDGHHSSLVIGKKGYSSPEQIAGGAVDRRSDIYSMGATYYKALSGITPQESGLRMMNDHVTPLKHLGLGISESVSDAVMKAMSVKPEDRYADAAAFQQALKAQTEEKPTTAVQPPSAGKGKGTGSAAAGGEPPKKKPKTAIIAAAVLAVLAGGFFLFRDKIIPAPGPKTDYTALTQSAIDAEMTKIAEAQELAAGRQTATAQIIAQDAIAAEWTKLTETQEAEQAAQTEAARPTSTPVPTNTSRPTSTPEPTATKTRVPTNTPRPTSTPRPTATKTRVPTKTPRATATPDVEVLFETGSTYYSKGDYKNALKYFEASAVQGHATAQYRLGYMYENGLGVQQSDEKAMEWYQKAADQRHVSARVRLDKLKQKNAPVPTATPHPSETKNPGALYSLGYSCYLRNDYECALGYYEQAANLGNVSAQYSLGRMYEKGWGVEQSYEKAAEWYQKAADQGHSQSKWKLDDMKRLLDREPTVTPTPTVQPMADRFKVSWRIDIYNAKTDEIKGKNILYPDIRDLAENEEYVIVFTVENNTSEQLTPVISAVIDGVYLDWPETTISSYSGWNFYITDSGEPGTHDWRFYINRKKAAEGKYTIADTTSADAESLFEMANSYYSRGDYKNALKYFESSAAQGYAKAQYFLGYMYQKGLGVQQSGEKAMEWYQKAADQGNISAKAKLDELNKTKSPEAADEMSADQLFALANSCYDKADYENAFTNYEKAAERGHKESQYFTGFLYEKGWGVEQSYEKAAEWYQKAADQGHSLSKWKLDDMKKLLNREPTVTPTPTVQRMADLFDVSWRVDIYNAKTDKLEGKNISDPDIKDLSENEAFVIVFTVENTTSDQLKKGFHAVIDGVYVTWNEVTIPAFTEWNFYITDSGEPGTHDWKFYIGSEKAGEGKYTIADTTSADAKSLFETANSYYSRGDYENAFTNYEKAAERGHKESQYFTGFLYEKGWGVEQSYEKAAEWYQKAADQGHSQSKWKLDDMKKLLDLKPTAVPTAVPAAEQGGMEMNKISVNSAINIYIETDDGQRAGYDWEADETFSEIPGVEVSRSMGHSSAVLPNDLKYYLWMNYPENEAHDKTFDAVITSPGRYLKLTNLQEAYSFPNFIYNPPTYNRNLDMEFESFEMAANGGELPDIDFTITDEYGEYNFTFTTTMRSGEGDSKAKNTPVDFLIVHNYDEGDIGIWISAYHEEDTDLLSNAVFDVAAEFTLWDDEGKLNVKTPKTKPISLNLNGSFWFNFVDWQKGEGLTLNADLDGDNIYETIRSLDLNTWGLSLHGTVPL